METKLIVKFRRANDCWICPDCDGENDIVSNRCMACGCEKTYGVNIVKAWSPESERINTFGTSGGMSSGYGSSRGGEYHKTDIGSSYYGSETNYTSWIVAAVLVALIIVLVLVLS